MRKKHMLLQTVNVTRQKQLTPKAKKLYKMCRNLTSKWSKSQRKVRTFQARLAEAEGLSETYSKIMDRVNPITYKFIMSQVKTQYVAPKGRRFTTDDKILALSIYKSGPRAYRLLSKIFSLPSRKTLTNLLKGLQFEPGLNSHIFSTLKECISNLKEKDRQCILMFDEMAVSCGLHYNRKRDCFDGLEDTGFERKPLLADHATVFMVKGISKQWKQPVSFIFTSGPMKGVVTKNFIRETIEKCQEIGLRVVATVCDQGSANQSAINLLLEDTREMFLKKGEENRYFGFDVNGSEIVPLYDVPHLFKGLRNNLLTKHLQFHLEGNDFVAKWDHIVQFFYLDCAEDTRICPKLTEAHVILEKINKMKVSHCTQVFSHQVGSLMLRISKWNVQSECELPADALHTAKLILFLDKLFDSLNGSTKKAPESKPLKGGVTEVSGHDSFWTSTLPIINSMRFYSPTKKTSVVVPSVRNLAKTIRGFHYLKGSLLNTKYSYFLPRTFNQDALENFFGCVRSHGARNVNPTVQNFMASFKALLISNCMASHSPGANCEEDHTEGALDSLRCLVLGESIAGVHPLISEVNEGDLPQIPAEVLQKQLSRVAKCTLSYISGYVGKKALEVTKNCNICKNNLFSQKITEHTDFIDARTYTASKLHVPGSFLNFVVNKSICYLFYILPRICHLLNIKQILIKFLIEKINFTPLICNEHQEIHKKLCDIITTCVLYFWCRQINLILKGKDVKFIKGKTNPDPIKMQAYKKYCSFRKYKRPD